MALKDILRFFSKFSTPHKETPQPNEDILTFYHARNHLNNADSFIKEGAKPIGKGVGGQTDGFYCWSRKGNFFCRLFALEKNDGLLVCVQENKKMSHTRYGN